MAVVGERCHENEYHPACGYLTPINNGDMICADRGPCHKLGVEAIEERLAYIRRACHSNRSNYQVSANTLYFLLSVIDGLRERNKHLETSVFNGFDPNGRTNIHALGQDLVDELEEEGFDGVLMGNERLLSLIRRHRA